MGLQGSEVQILSPRPFRISSLLLTLNRILIIVHILISNDDGYFSEGIKCLRNGLEKTEHAISMIAPRENNSACGMSITVRESLDVEKIDEHGYVVSGTPVDCVGIGLGGLLEEPVDIVVSGINNGPNLADDVLYSGTVAAAVEARRLSYPNIAVSMTSRMPNHYETALQVVLDILKSIEGKAFSPTIALLNINVPDLPYEKLKGIRVTRLAERSSPENPKFKPLSETHWKVNMGGVGDFFMRDNDCQYHYDCESVDAGYVSVTPIRSKYIDTPYLDQLNQLLDKSISK